MKYFISSSALFVFFALSFMQGGLTSCTKDKLIYDTVIVVKKDTVIIKDTLIIKDSAFTAELLTAYPWKLRELRAVYGGDSLYYLQGGSNNTAGPFNLSLETYTFNANGSGSLLDGANSTHPIENWKFENAEKTKLTFLLHATTSISSIARVVTWENIRFKGGTIYTDEYQYDNYAFKHYHGQAIRYQAK